MPRATLCGLPEWVDASRLLGPGSWQRDVECLTAELSPHDAADLAARLRGVHLGGARLELRVEPPLPRALVRAARTADARRRRDTTPGFTRPGVRLDDGSRIYLTPEALALALARPYAGRRVVDATCGAGGNAIGFARAGCEVVAVDRNARMLELARHNARIYGVVDRIRFVHGRAETLDLKGDVLFLDPPWGTDWNRERGTLDDLPELAGLLRLAANFEETLVKVPPSFDPATLRVETRPEAWFGRAAGDHRRVKFLILRIER